MDIDLLTSPEGKIADEEMRRLVAGETADAGAVQVVMTADQWKRYKKTMTAAQREVYEIESGRPDLPTYGSRYWRHYT